jgi:hypothetical protein
MGLSARLLPLALILATPACISSSIVLHVNADGTGQAVVMSRVSLSGIQALDSVFPDAAPKAPPTLEDLLPPASPGAVTRAFGMPVRLTSSTLRADADGGVRTTVVEFDDITRLRLALPSDLSVPGDAAYGFPWAPDDAIITFTRQPHPNGDEMLIVRMPDPPLKHDDRNEPITKVESGSQEQAFTRAIKGLAFRFTVELDRPVLRTNAPKMSDHGATILDLDMDRMINAMDEAKARRLTDANSFQDFMGQLGDLPGASIPADREVFLEYESPQRSAPPPAQSASPAQAPPDTEIYLAPLRIAGGAVTVGEPQNITNNPGYDNQPFFTPDGRAILFTSIRGGGTQSDIYRYNVITAETTQVTNTPESEYSPTLTPSGALAVVRVELDGQNTQRLWQFTADGRDPKVLLPDLKPVGYHAWADDHTVALFILGSNGAPATLQLADTRTGAAVTLATDIGRSILTIPGTGATHTISFVQRERAGGKTSLVIKELDPASRAITVLTPAVEGSTEADLAWAPDGTLLMANAGKLYSWRRGQSGWTEVASLEQHGLRNVTRLAVSPRGSSIAIVAAPPAAR